MPTSVTAPQAASPANDTSAQASLQALHRVIAVDRLLSIQDSFQSSLRSLCEAVCSGVGTDRAMLGLVGAESDHYPLQVGFEPPMASHAHGLGRTLCQHLVLRGSCLVIDDTHASPTWADVKSVREGSVGAYLGVPVRFQGELVGSLCAVSHVPRVWQARDQAVMAALAHMAEDVLETAWQQAVARQDAEQTQLRLQALEAGIIQRQMAFREIRQALAMQVARLRLHPDAERAGEAVWLEALHQQLGEVNEGVLSELSNAVARPLAADTSCGELLALAAHVVAPDRIRLTEAGDAPSCLSAPVVALRQPALLRVFVTLLRESLRSLSAQQGVAIHLQPLAEGRCAMRVQAWRDDGGAAPLSPDLPRHLAAMLCSTLRELDAHLCAHGDDACGPGLMLTWAAAA